MSGVFSIQNFRSFANSRMNHNDTWRTTYIQVWNYAKMGYIMAYIMHKYLGNMMAAEGGKVAYYRYSTRAIVFATPAAYFAGKVPHTFALVLYLYNYMKDVIEVTPLLMGRRFACTSTTSYDWNHPHRYIDTQA